jgi:hypothetical protein
MLVIFHLKHGMPSNRKSTICDDFVPSSPILLLLRLRVLVLQFYFAYAPMATNTVRVSNVSPKATEHDIQDFFSFSGEIEHIELHK